MEQFQNYINDWQVRLPTYDIGAYYQEKYTVASTCTFFISTKFNLQAMSNEWSAGKVISELWLKTKQYTS